MGDNKYDKIIEELYEEIGVEGVKEFSEETLAVLNDLNNGTVATYTIEDWDDVVDYIADNPIPALFVSAFKSPYLPKGYFEKIYNLTDSTTVATALFSDKVPVSILKQVYKDYDYGIVQVLQDFKNSISQKTIKYYCENISAEDLEAMNYAPFRYLKTSHATFKKLNDMLDNKKNKFFKEDIPESFLLAIMNNENLSDSIRNKAFNIGFNPDKILNATEYMKTELYKFYADTIFELDNNSLENKKYIDKAINILKDTISVGELPSSCQFDFINRVIEYKIVDNDKLNVLNEIAEITNNYDILKKMLDVNSPEINNIIAKNYQHIDGTIMTNLLKRTTFESFSPTFIRAIFHTFPTYDILKDYHFMNNHYINTAMMISKKINIEGPILNTTKADKKKDMMKYLYSLKSEISKFPYVNSQKILCFAASKFLDLDYKANHVLNLPRESLNSAISFFCPNGWNPISKEEYNILNSWIKNKEKEFPKFEYINNKMKEKLDETFRLSQFVLKYPTIFVVNQFNGPSEINHVGELRNCGYFPCNKINGDELCKLSDKKIDEFTKDIIAFNDEDICETIKQKILDSCDLSFIEHQGEIFEKIYKLTDLYNVCNEIIKEKEQEKYQTFEKLATLEI